MVQVNVLEAKNQLSQLIKDAANGQDVVIANRGVPVARLIPYSAHAVGTGESITRWLEANPMPDRPARSQEDIQRQIEEERAGWD